MAEFTLGAYERACPNIQAPKISASDTLWNKKLQTTFLT
jgi:hypothetical protein